MVQSYEQFNKPYRRGLVLGLSLAEIFLILLFLLLLVGVAISSLLDDKEKELKDTVTIVEETRKENVELTDKLTEARRIIAGNKINDARFNDLIESSINSEKIENDLRDKLADEQKVRKAGEEKIKELEQFEKIKQALDDANLDSDDVKELADKIKESDQHKEIKQALDDANLAPDDVKELADKIKESDQYKEIEQALDDANLTPDDVKNLADKIKEADQYKEIKQALDDANLSPDKLKSLVSEVKELKDKLDKGLNPPCWYTKEPDSSKLTKYRESHVPIYDIKITNTRFVVREHISNEEGIIKGNVDAMPTISRRRFNSELTAEDFIKNFQPIYDVGENQEIHSYKCRFLANVYDFTSANNKKEWKSNLRTVERLFIKNEGTNWPGR